MLKISVRQFTQQPTEYISKLPITLTTYGRDVAILIKPEGVQTTPEVKVPVPNTMVPNIIGQIEKEIPDNKTLKFQQLKETIKQMENGSTGQHPSVTELMVKSQKERDYYVDIGCKRLNVGGRMIWVCPHDLEVDRCDICSPKLNITQG